MENNPIQSIGSSGGEKWLSMSEAALGTPYSAEYLSLLARKNKLSAKKIDNTWFTTRQVVEDYMRRQMIRTEVQNGNIPQTVSTPVPAPLPQVSVMPQAKSVSTLRPIRSYKDDHNDYQARLKSENPQIEIEQALEKVIDKKFSPGWSSSFKQGFKTRSGAIDHATEAVKSVRHLPRALASGTLIAIISLTILPIPFAFGFLEKGLDKIVDAVSDARTVMGFRPGTHENELLLLDKEGNIAIMGHVETGGQLRSNAPSGVAPMVVDSATLVANLNADLLDNMQAQEFTLAYVTKNGTMTTENVQLYGNVEIGKTLLIKGATKLLSELEVGGDLRVFGEAEFKQALRVLGPAEFEGVVNMMNNVSMKKNLNVRGSVTSGSAVIGKKAGFEEGSIGDLVSDTFEVVTATITNLIADDITADALTAASSTLVNVAITNANAESLLFTSATGTSATTTNLYSNLGTFQTLSVTGDATVTGDFTVAGDTVTIGQLLSTRVPTLPHVFTTWPAGTSNASDATIYINPATAAADTNIFAAAVGGVVKFLVDAEGDMYANNLVLAGSTSLGETTVAGNLAVQDAATLGDAASDLITINGQLLALASTTLQNFTFRNATGTAATTTNFFATTASSTNLYATSLSAGGGTLGGLTMTGNVLASTGGINIGSSGTRFGTIYADTVDATSLTGTVVSGSTSANDWLINSDNATADTENMTLGFERGSLTPNALLTWNATSDRFEFNSDLYVGSGIGNGTLLVNGSTTLQNLTFVNATGTAATTTNLYTSGQTILAGSTGRVGVGTTTPQQNLVVGGTGNTVSEVAGIGIPGLKIRDYSASGRDWRLEQSRTTTGTFSITDCTSGSCGEKISINSSGDVGIGDTTPAALLTVGSGDVFQVNSSGAIAAATGITSSGSITFSGLTAARNVCTTTGGQLTTTCSSADMSNSISDETGTGVAVFATSPTLVTPNIGAATGSSLNLGSGTITSGAINGQTISSAANFTGTVAIATSATIAGSTVYHAGNDPLDTIAEWQSLCTNCADIVNDTTGTLTVARGGTGVTTSTGSGSVVLSTSPTLTTPNIGAATGSSLNIGSGTITSGAINGQTISSAANFTGTMAIGGAVTLAQNTSIGTSGMSNLIRDSYWGYSTSYRTAQIGTGTQTVSLGVDLTGNTSGAFSGNGGEVVFKNAVNLMMPNAANNSYVTFLDVDASGNLVTAGTINSQTISSSANLTGTLAVASTITEAGSAVLSAADVDTCAEVAALVVETGSCGSVVMSASPTLTGTTRFDFGSGFTAINTGFASSHGYSTGNWGVRLGATGSTGVIQAAQDTTAYTLALNPYGGAVTIGGNTALHAGNYTSYSPSLTGSGASGTWGISITGSAGSVACASVTGNGVGCSDVYVNTGGDTMTGDLTFSQVAGNSTRNNSIIGTYSPTSLAQIWAMGDSYQIAADGSTGGSLYGLNYSYEPNYSSPGTNPGAIAGLGHQMQWRAAGSTQTAIGTGIWTNGGVTATSFTGSGSGLTSIPASGVTGTAWTQSSLTNLNQLSNGPGYITDGNTGWDNAYGYITNTNANLYLNGGGATDRITNVNTSGFGIDALNNGNWDLLVYNGGSLYFTESYYGYGGTAYLRTYDTNENLNIDPNGSGSVDVESPATTVGYWLDGKAALTGESTDNWLRLNQNSSWTNGVYTPGVLRVDGGIASGGIATQGSGTINATGIYYGNSKRMFTTTDTYLRINENLDFGSGIWLGSSNIGGAGNLHLGSNGGATTARVRIDGGTYNGSTVIHLNGVDGGAYIGGTLSAAGAVSMGGGRLYMRADDSGTSPGLPWIRGNGSHLVINPVSGNSLYVVWDAGNYLMVGGLGVQSGIYYDRDSTSYYVDPASTSNMADVYVSNLYAGGQVSAGTCLTDPNFPCDDIAEEFPLAEVAEAGDILAIAPEAGDAEDGFALKKAVSTDSVVGIISSAPAILIDGNQTRFGTPDTGNTYGPGADAPLALAGRVPVKFSEENGPINAGDYLTVSPTQPGKAVKAVSAGQVIGQALTSSATSIDGKVLAYVTHFFYTPPQSIASVSTSTPGFIASVLETISATIVDGVTKFVALIVDNMSAYALTVGRPEQPAGITIYDEDTGEPYCMKVKSGQQIAMAGVCGTQPAQAPENNGGGDTTYTPIEITGPTASSTEPTASSTPETTEPEPAATSTEPVMDPEPQPEPVPEPEPSASSTEPANI